jgi:hypothetical protein
VGQWPTLAKTLQPYTYFIWDGSYRQATRSLKRESVSSKLALTTCCTTSKYNGCVANLLRRGSHQQAVFCFIFVLASGSRDRQDVSICVCRYFDTGASPL